MSLRHRVLLTGATLGLILIVALIHDRLTFSPGMIEWRDDIEKWRPVRMSLMNRIVRSGIVAVLVVAIPWLFRRFGPKA